MQINIQGSTHLELTRQNFKVESGESSISCSGNSVTIKGGTSSMLCNDSGIVLNANDQANITLDNEGVHITAGDGKISCSSSGIKANCDIEARSIYSLTQYKIKVATLRRPKGKVFSALAAASDESSEREAVAVGLIPLDENGNPNLTWEYGTPSDEDEKGPDGGFIHLKYFSSHSKKVVCRICAEHTRVLGRLLCYNTLYLQRDINKIYVRAEMGGTPPPSHRNGTSLPKRICEVIHYQEWQQIGTNDQGQAIMGWADVPGKRIGVLENVFYD